MIDYSEDDYHEMRHPEFLGNNELQRAWSAFAYKLYFSKLLNGDRKKIFEFGGAFGYNLLEMVGAHDCSLLELSKIGRTHAEKLGIATYTDEAELKGLSFDIILCRHVLEHVDNPLITLRYLSGLLAPGGCLVLVLPLDASGDMPVSREIDYHLYCWNARTACNLVQRAGLKVKTWRYNYYNGRRAMMPVYKMVGMNFYAKSVWFLGRIKGCRELVLEITNEQL
jgi:SAM-dependent methyltransferase